VLQNTAKPLLLVDVDEVISLFDGIAHFLSERSAG